MVTKNLPMTIGMLAFAAVLLVAFGGNLRDGSPVVEEWRMAAIKHLDARNATAAYLGLNVLFETILWIVLTLVALTAYYSLNAWLATNSHRWLSGVLAAVYILFAVGATISLAASTADLVRWGFVWLAIGYTVTAVWVTLTIISLTPKLAKTRTQPSSQTTP